MESINWLKAFILSYIKGDGDSLVYDYLISDRFWDDVLFVLKGLPDTLLYTFCSIIFGLILGLILALCKASRIKILKLMANIYISIFRGTPMLLQLVFIYQGLSLTFHLKLTAFEAGVLGLSLNSAAYIAEIIRAGIQSIDTGQFEGARALHITRYLMWKDIILPQAIKNILPAMFNELITLLKDTSLLSALGVSEVLRRASLIGSEIYNYFGPLIIAAVIYYIIVILLTIISGMVERSFIYSSRKKSPSRN